MLEKLIEEMPRGSSIYKRENIRAWVVSFPACVPNQRNKFNEFTHENLVVALEQAFAWYAQRPTKREGGRGYHGGKK